MSTRRPSRAPTRGDKRRFSAGALLVGALMAFFTAAPTAHAQIIDHIRVELRTGDDDLRGGGASTIMRVAFQDGSRSLQEYIVINENGVRLPDRTNRVLQIRVRDPYRWEHVRSFIIECGGCTGGLGGDNWNIDRLRLVAVFRDGGERELYFERGRPLARLTGDDPAFRRTIRVR